MKDHARNLKRARSLLNEAIDLIGEYVEESGDSHTRHYLFAHLCLRSEEKKQEHGWMGMDDTIDKLIDSLEESSVPEFKTEEEYRAFLDENDLTEEEFDEWAEGELGDEW